MSVKQEFDTLNQTEQSLQKKMDSILSDLNHWYTKRDVLVKRAEVFSCRTSALALDLLDRTKKEIEKMDQEISLVNERLVQIAKALECNQQKIAEMEDNPKYYIREQTSLMVSQFYQYMKNHLEALGLQIKKTYKIMEVTRFMQDRYLGCDIPTGNIGIYDESMKAFIVQSSDFYFRKPIYTISRDAYKTLVCKHAQWYKDYLHQFIPYLLSALQKNYPFGETFQLTISNSGFTLELV